MSWFFLCNTNFMHPAGMLGSEETTCTTRMLKSYVYGEITDHALNCKVNLSLRVTLHCMVNASVLTHALI